MHFQFEVSGEKYEIHLEAKPDGMLARSGAETYAFEIIEQRAGQLTLRLGQRIVRLYTATQGAEIWVSYLGCTYRFEKPSGASGRRHAQAGSGGQVRSPMPAQVRQVLVNEGDVVKKGDPLMLLEAMKMEIRLQAPRDGKISRLQAQPGSSVERDQILVEIESQEIPDDGKIL